MVNGGDKTNEIKSNDALEKSLPFHHQSLSLLFQPSFFLKEKGRKSNQGGINAKTRPTSVFCATTFINLAKSRNEN